MPSCVMRFCTNYYRKASKSHGITYHSFPSSELRRIQWVDVVRLQRKEENWQPHSSSKICSIHFKDNDKYTTAKGLTLLKKTALPCLEIRFPGQGMPHRMSLVGAAEERECARVKEELAEAWSVEEGLYAGHEVKDELVIGPESLQPPDSAFTTTDTAPGTGLVMPHRMSLVGVAEEGESVSVKEEPVEEWSAEEDLYAGHEVKDELVIGPERLQPPDYIPVVHTGEKPFICSHCSYTSSRKSNLLIHERTHTGEKPYECDICDYKASHMKSLKIHLMSVHAGVKPFKCSYCSYTSSRKSDLLIHERTHTGEKPFKCSYCSHTSSRKSDLLIHERRTHTGEKPFKCSYCSHMSSRKSDLLIHERTHTGEKPYKCDICDYKAADTSTLKRHVKRIHTREKQTF